MIIQLNDNKIKLNAYIFVTIVLLLWLWKCSMLCTVAVNSFIFALTIVDTCIGWYVRISAPLYMLRHCICCATVYVAAASRCAIAQFMQLTIVLFKVPLKVPRYKLLSLRLPLWLFWIYQLFKVFNYLYFQIIQSSINYQISC